MDIVSPPPNISLKTHPVHKLVQETYIEQASIGWNHVMRGRVSQKWLEAQTLHNISRKSKNRAQGHVVIRIIWTAIEHLWLAKNRMEHGAMEEERLLHQTARMNEKLKRVFLKKFKVSEIARTQLFQIPQCHRQ